MAKWIKYYLNTTIEKDGERVENLTAKAMSYSEENLTIAEKEAYNSQYTVEDDGQPEPEVQHTEAERISELEEALAMLLSGVTE